MSSSNSRARRRGSGALPPDQQGTLPRFAAAATSPRKRTLIAGFQAWEVECGAAVIRSLPASLAKWRSSFTMQHTVCIPRSLVRVAAPVTVPPRERVDRTRFEGVTVYVQWGPCEPPARPSLMLVHPPRRRRVHRVLVALTLRRRWFLRGVAHPASCCPDTLHKLPQEERFATPRSWRS